MHYSKSIVVPVAIWVTYTLAQAVDLGSAASYAVLGSTTVTSTGSTVLDGNLAVSPGTASTGFPPGVVMGITSDGDAAASTAHTDANNAYNMATAFACGTDLTGVDLGGRTLTPGIYCFSSSVGITGTLTLDARGNSNALFVFQIGSTLITATAGKVVLINGAKPCSVTWAVGSSATLGTSTDFEGNILALISITANSGVVCTGGLYALTGAVTLIDDHISAAGSCGKDSPPVKPPLSTVSSSPPQSCKAGGTATITRTQTDTVTVHKPTTIQTIGTKTFTTTAIVTKTLRIR